MKPLKQLLEGIPCVWNGKGDLTSLIRNIQSDSRKVEPGDLFIALSGLHYDGHQFIQEATRRGAKAIVSEECNPQLTESGIAQFVVSNSRPVWAQMTATAFGDPAKRLKCIGVTGTNGKTTTAFIIQYLINSISKCGLIGSIYYDDGNQKHSSTHTTPTPEMLHQAFGNMVNARLFYCAMEVSSHALDQDRTAGIEFSSAIFTNLTQDHLDYHQDFESYFRAKRKLFFESNPEESIINADDSYGIRLINELKESNRKYVTYGINNKSDYSAKDLHLSWNGTEFVFSAKGKEFQVRMPLILKHNVYNSLAALASLSEMGFSIPEMIHRLSCFPGVPGRMERIDEGQDFHVFVDYAHTPDGLFNVLSSIEELPKGRVISIFGCGGDRDPGKRPLMGEVASRFSDVVILTTDNSRGERSEDILKQIKNGIDTRRKIQTLIISDRKEAIGHAIEMAEPNDIILIFGKGHENYQIIGNEKIPFQDQEVARGWLKKRCSHLAKS